MNNTSKLPVLQPMRSLSADGQQTGLAARGLDMLGALPQVQEDDTADLQWKLGCEYLKGNGSESDYAWAYYWFSNAAHLGHVEAQFALASMYEAGTGVKQDDAQAIAWYQKAAMQGHAWATYNLDMRGIRVETQE